MMRLLSYYQSLPDVMTTQELQQQLDELLLSASSQERMLAGEALCQLADRYWHTYENLPAPYKSNLTKWIEANWLPVDLTFIETCGFIIGHLGLSGALEFISQQRTNTKLPAECAAEVDQFVTELSASVADPYHSLRNLSTPTPRSENS
jgi:hypothetical protein